MASFYQTYAMDYSIIDMDEQGLFVLMPSERDVNVKYTVRCDEHKDSVDVVNCDCPGHKRHSKCKHADACNAYWTKMYRSNQAKLAAKAEAEKQAANREAELAVKEAEKIVAPQYTNMFKRPRQWATERAEADRHYREGKAQAREIREHREYAPLNGNRAFSILR